eukprot:TRINITY_DN33586_c0_g1_i1.p1 TRINITY_DN33586_c0_g1~~TRINITY_DN33586_c0_g1_i1.p1  ORF type:complete len:737 (-),score=224.60 TRINITY_DN33586_c0_g1_i1:43-2163(-)
MAGLRCAFALLFIVAVAGESPQKSAAIDKVVVMLRELKTKVSNEGEKENKTFRKFQRFCADTKTEKTVAIEAANNTKASLASDAKVLNASVDMLGAKILELQEDIAKDTAALKEVEDARTQDRKQHLKSTADMNEAIGSLEKAMQALKASKKVSLLQREDDAAEKMTLRALEIARNLGLTSKVKALPDSAYSFQSDSIMETLEGLHEDFRKAMSDAAMEDQRAHNAHGSTSLALSQALERKRQELKQAVEQKATKEASIQQASAELKSTAESLADDEQYLTEISAMCADKAATFANRTATRQEELGAIASAISIMAPNSGDTPSSPANGAVSFELAKAAARTPAFTEAAEAAAEAIEAGSASLLSASSGVRSMRKSSNLRASVVSRHVDVDGVRQVLKDFLRPKADALQSPALLSIADAVATDPLESVKQMMSGMITSLKKEAAESQSHRAWCEHEESGAKAKRDESAAKINEINLAIAGEEARRDKLTEEDAMLEQELAELSTALANASQLRAEEEAEANASIVEATKAKEAVAQARKALADFYDKPKGSSALTQMFYSAKPGAVPNAGFEGEYAGAKDSAGGVMALLEVIESGFARSMEETHAEEALATKELSKLRHDTGISEAEKKKAREIKDKLKTECEMRLRKDQESLKMHSASLKAALTELAGLDKACGIGTTASQRSSRRAEQMDALKEAITMFDSSSF